MAYLPKIFKLSDNRQVLISSGMPRLKAASQPPVDPPPEPGSYYPLTTRVIHSGHSLTDAALYQGTYPSHGPALLQGLGGNLSANIIDKSTVPGSPMNYRRLNQIGYGAPDSFRDIANYDLLVITENNWTAPESLFPSGWQVDSRNERREELRIWLDNTWTYGKGGAGAPLIFYTPWLAMTDYAPSPSWRSRLAADEVEYLARVTYAEANKTTNAPPIRMIPGNAFMMKLWDDAEAGAIPGISSAAQWMADRAGWFMDDVHPNGYGMLALAYLHFAVIYGINPETLPHTGFGLSHTPDSSLAAYLKTTTKNLALSYPRALV